MGLVGDPLWLMAIRLVVLLIADSAIGCGSTKAMGGWLQAAVVSTNRGDWRQKGQQERRQIQELSIQSIQGCTKLISCRT